VRELGCDVPIHFTAFHPDYKLTDLPPTPPATLSRARAIAQAAGIRYVYTGNVHDTDGGATRCPGCGSASIVRDWHEILAYRLTPEGCCDACGTPIAGRFEAFSGQFGRRRIPVRAAVSAS
jgi:pyruvate formate lyase activating enzyme